MIIHHAKQTLIKENSTVHVVYIGALCDYILTTMQQGLGVKCVHNRWAYATYTLLPMHEIGQNQRKKGGWAYITSWAYITYSTVLSRRFLELRQPLLSFSHVGMAW